MTCKGTGDAAGRLPRTAYVLLWFPKPSETFIFRECSDLSEMGLPLSVHTLYGRLERGLSREMTGLGPAVTRMGVSSVCCLFRDFFYWLRCSSGETRRVAGDVLFRRRPSVEMAGENTWAFFCGFTLARRFLNEGIEHIHAPWACGPCTAAWVASRLSGIPFSFAGRSHDIYPPSDAIREKIRDASFVRVNTRTNLDYLRSFVNGGPDKIRLVYNGLSLPVGDAAPVHMTPPFRIVAIGRLVPTKGYSYLLRACGILRGRGVDFRLTIAGEGGQLRALKRLAGTLGIADRVDFPGHVVHDRVPELLMGADMFVMPSVVVRSGNRDGIPNAMLEALVYRVPVIATDISGIGEVVEDGVTGLLVPERDADALARAIQNTLGDRGGALKMAAGGRERVARMFDSSANHGRMLELISAGSRAAHGAAGS